MFFLYFALSHCDDIVGHDATLAPQVSYFPMPDTIYDGFKKIYANDGGRTKCQKAPAVITACIKQYALKINVGGSPGVAAPQGDRIDSTHAAH
ncbi:hypothetical protein BGZ46_003100 [Entomortierella lignicola]|nr:hypothetical protein BGZ46_003100 [Entomortierella lignicola]